MDDGALSVATRTGASEWLVLAPKHRVSAATVRGTAASTHASGGIAILSTTALKRAIFPAPHPVPSSSLLPVTIDAAAVDDPERAEHESVRDPAQRNIAAQVLREVLGPRVANEPAGYLTASTASFATDIAMVEATEDLQTGQGPWALGDVVAFFDPPDLPLAPGLVWRAFTPQGRRRFEEKGTSNPNGDVADEEAE